MPLAIYQIGDLPVFFNISEINDTTIKLSADRSWRYAKTELTNVPGSHSQNDPLRPMPETQQLELSGTIVCEDGVSAESIFSHLVSMGGIINTPIVGFRYEECDHTEGQNVCCSQCNLTLDWIQNSGIITKADQTGGIIDSKKPWTSSVMPVKITMILNSKWKALNAWEWEYRRNAVVVNPLDPNLTRSSPSNTFILPQAFQDLTKAGYFFKWGLSLSKYSPIFWEDKYTEGRLGGYGINFSDLGKYPFSSDPKLWSAAPNSVYSFTNFSNTTGTLEISVTKNAGYFFGTGITEISSLDLDDVNTDLLNSGNAGLFLDDIIVTGFANPFPGFIVRDDEIINGIRPRWSYVGRYPGETARGINQVEFVGNEVNAQVAFLHDFCSY